MNTEIKCLILDIAQGQFEGNDWQSIIVRLDNKLVKFKVNLNKIKFTDEDKDKEFTLMYELHGSASQPAVARIVGVSK